MAPSGNKGCSTVQKQFGWLTPMNRNIRVKANPRRPTESNENSPQRTSESNGYSRNPQRPSAYNGNSARKGKGNDVHQSIHRFRLLDSTIDDDETEGLDYDTPAPDTDDTEIAGLKADMQRINEQPKRKGRGPAKGTKFDKLRKLAKIPLSVKENARGDSSEYTRIFTERCTYIIKHFADVGCRSWMHMSQEDKDELYTRVLGDFVLDWDRFEDQECVKTQLQVSFRQYRYKLHGIYKKFNNVDIARANPPDDVSAAAWEKLCDIWQSEEYQKLCKKNAANRNKLKINHTSGSKSLHRLRLEKKEEDGTTIEFYKRSRIHKDGTWVCQEALQIYQKMIELQKERDPDQKDEAIAEEIFTEVLGRKSGYVRGMGKSMIPPPVSESRSAKVTQMSKQVDKYKSELEYYKNAYEGLTNEVKVLNERCNDYAGRYASYDEKLQYLYKQLPSDNQNEADGDETE